ncbi:HpcH/HpaI aldolase family protein [Bryobacter aggregatus]|uniref:HpcH/HpaI aldolase family protein n=1 Tax=Bryobacter aggregatus TaxID=360054 RepID=UPI0004E1ABBF|nr:aldolase/citrate lyase family protein [Bryobacter aggregatus]
MTRSLSLLLVLGSIALAPAQQPGRIFNTVKSKLAAGKQVVGGTVQIPDPDTYCAMAHSGYDFLWIEMQHSPMTYQDVAHMIMACKGAPAMPFIRVPDATEGDIQKAMDIGAVGIIIPMVEDVEKVKNAIKFANYPPIGKRSQGGGQYGALWGDDYRAIANQNLMIVAMIESPAGVKIATEIASIPGVDVVFVASSDLSSFSGLKQGDAKYEAMVDTIREATLKAGKKVAGPLAWKSTRKGYAFYQGPSETSLIKTGAKLSLGDSPLSESKRGVAQMEGSEKH